MKKILLFLTITVFSIILVSCEEPEAPLQFDIIENSDEDANYISYHSTGVTPFPGTKQYHIFTKVYSGEIKLECNNCNDIEIETSFSDSFGEATAEETGIFVTLENGNIITIRLAEKSFDIAMGYYCTIKVFGKVRKNMESTTININRYSVKSIL